MMETTDPLAGMREHADAVDKYVQETTTRALVAEKERDKIAAEAEALRAERDAGWKARVEEAKKLHPGTADLLKMLVASTREEWVAAHGFLEQFDGHLPPALARIDLGIAALLNGDGAEG